MVDREQTFAMQKQILHLEDTVHQLNQVVIHQQKQVDILKQTVNKLVQEHLELKEMMSPEIENTRPPHY